MLVLVGRCVIGNILRGVHISIVPRCIGIGSIPGIPVRKHAINTVLRKSTIPMDGPKGRGMSHQANIVNSIALADVLSSFGTCAYRLLGGGISPDGTCDIFSRPIVFPLGPGVFEVLDIEVNVAFGANHFYLLHVYDKCVLGAV